LKDQLVRSRVRCMHAYLAIKHAVLPFVYMLTLHTQLYLGQVNARHTLHCDTMLTSPAMHCAKKMHPFQNKTINTFFP
jgi:hypothetical protein